jgi:transcriptional regulator of acetoin/glycerol metabolism
VRRFQGNRKQAADARKISAVTLWRKMKQYGLAS